MSLAGCTTEYHGYVNSGIDDVLWRQIASFKDPLGESAYRSTATEPVGYLGALNGEPWDGTPGSLSELHLEEGGAIIYDESSTDSTAKFSVFIASGPRPDVPTDEGFPYFGPSQVFTCYSLEVDFDSDEPPGAAAFPVAFDECPAALVELLPDDAAFASAEVFTG